MRKLWSILVLLIVFTAGAQAQILENSFHLNAAADTLTNPAFQHGERAFEVSLGLGLDVGLNSWNPALILRYGSKDLDEKDKDVIIQATNDELLRLRVEGQPYLGLKYNQFGLRVAGKAMANGQLPTDVLRLALKGNELNKEYLLEDVNGEAAGYIEAAALFAMPINELFELYDFPEIVVGISPKYLHGLAFGRFTGEASLETQLADGAAKVVGTGEGKYAYSRAGAGFALDFGVSAHISDELRVDASVLNLGSMTWRDVQEGAASGEVDVRISDIENAKFDYAVEDLKPGPDITWKVPRTYRIGGAYKATSQLTVLADFSFSQSEAVGLTSRHAVGVEYRPWDFMPIQAGLIKHSKAPFRIDLGWGLEFASFELGIGLNNVLGLVLPRSQGMGLHLQTSVRF